VLEDGLHAAAKPTATELEDQELCRRVEAVFKHHKPERSVSAAPRWPEALSFNGLQAEVGCI
jgi:hypothetical protein